METSRDFDPSALERVYALGGPVLVKRLLTMVLESAPRKVSEAATCARRGDYAGAAFAAHALRSTAANAGAVRVTCLARDLEREARAGHGDTAVVLAGELESAAAEMQANLRTLVERAA